MLNSLYLFLNQKISLKDALVSLKFFMLLCSLSQLSQILHHHKTTSGFPFSPSDLTPVLNLHAI